MQVFLFLPGVWGKRLEKHFQTPELHAGRARFDFLSRGAYALCSESVKLHLSRKESPRLA